MIYKTGYFFTVYFTVKEKTLGYLTDYQGFTSFTGGDGRTTDSI